MLSALVPALFYALLELLSLVGAPWSWDDEDPPPEDPPERDRR